MGVASMVKSMSVKRRWVASIVAVSLVMTGGVVAVRVLQDDDVEADCSRSERSTAHEAATMAAACGIEVEIVDERTPWVSVFATPDGTSRMTVGAVPQRTNVNGEWEPLDTRVAETPRIAAAAGGSGGSGQIASMSVGFAAEDIVLPPDVAGMLPRSPGGSPPPPNSAGSAPRASTPQQQPQRMEVPDQYGLGRPVSRRSGRPSRSVRTPRLRSTGGLGPSTA